MTGSVRKIRTVAAFNEGNHVVSYAVVMTFAWTPFKAANVRKNARKSHASATSYNKTAPVNVQTTNWKIPTSVSLVFLKRISNYLQPRRLWCPK